LIVITKDLSAVRKGVRDVLEGEHSVPLG